mmetsp:Transcript_16322/g.35267  ORF Transcript_16322/g.35267 Transcript_16322/m.35267 type:complete len:107 (-) Transcript_16322:23-343(-)
MMSSHLHRIKYLRAADQGTELTVSLQVLVVALLTSSWPIRVNERYPLSPIQNNLSASCVSHFLLITALLNFWAHVTQLTRSWLDHHAIVTIAMFVNVPAGRISVPG